MSNVLNVTKSFLSLLKVKYTNQYLADVVLSHQEYNSLLAVTDTLSKYNIENVAITIEKDRFDELPEPCIVQVDVRGSKLFYCIKSVKENIVVYYDDKGILQNMPKDEFQNYWTGIALLAETTEDSQEVDFKKKLAVKRVQTVLFSTVTFLFLSWLVLNFLKSEIIGNLSFEIFAIVYILLNVIGLIVGVLLLWFEVDQYNPTLQNFCSGGKKINCNAVLQSKHAKLFNGYLSLSILGFSYFFASFAFLIISRFSFSSFSFLALLSFIALPVIFISAYYQAIVIKQWCKFCMIIQSVLLVEIIVAFFGGFYKGNLIFEEALLFIVLLLLPVLSWKFIKPLLEKKEELNMYKRGLKRIKSNPIVLESLLTKSQKITTNTEGLGILLKNKNAKYTIIKVCNPYCGPCAKAHPILEALVEESIINLQMIFTASTDKNDYKVKPVRHFLAIDTLNNSNKTKQALDDWYMADKKDYNVFATRYPMNGELEQQDKKIKAMRMWCDAEKISHTPTIFINGYKLPEEYSIEDLKEVLV